MVFLWLTRRKTGVKTTIFTKPGKALQLDPDKHNSQYETIELKALTTPHDRLLIIDDKELYPIGASLKDPGKK